MLKTINTMIIVLDWKKSSCVFILLTVFCLVDTVVKYSRSISPRSRTFRIHLRTSRKHREITTIEYWCLGGVGINRFDFRRDVFDVPEPRYTIPKSWGSLFRQIFSIPPIFRFICPKNHFCCKPSRAPPCPPPLSTRCKNGPKKCLKKRIVSSLYQ